MKIRSKSPAQPQWRAGYHRVSDNVVLRRGFKSWDDAVADVADKLKLDDVDHAWVRAPDGKLFWTNDPVDWDHPGRNPLYRYVTVDFWSRMNVWLVNVFVILLFLGALSVVVGSLLLIVSFLAGWL